jgi:hypothetical protein
MKLSQAKEFHIRGFTITHRMLMVIYFGIPSLKPETSDPEIRITFSGTFKIDLPVDFLADAVELENHSTPIAEFKFPENDHVVFRFIFKNKSSIVGTVQALNAKIEILPKIIAPRKY